MSLCMGSYGRRFRRAFSCNRRFFNEIVSCISKMVLPRRDTGI